MEEDRELTPPSYLSPISNEFYNQSLIKDILDPTDVVEGIGYNLRGYKFNPKFYTDNNAARWIKDDSAKAIKKEGINLILGMLKEHLPKHQTLANLRESDIIRMARSIRLEIIDLIYENWEAFTYVDTNLSDPPIALFDKIVLLIDHNIFANLTRAKGGQENKLLRTVYRTHDTAIAERSTYEDNQQKGFSLKNMFGKKKPQQQYDDGYDGGY